MWSSIPDQSSHHVIFTVGAQGGELSKSMMSDSMDTDLPESAGDDAAQGSRPVGAAGAGPPVATSTSSDVALFAERAQFIPMRLDLEERRHFRLLEAALSVSEYTDKVDILTWKNKSARVVEQVKDICSILSGLKVAQVCLRMLCLVRRLVQYGFIVRTRFQIMCPKNGSNRVDLPLITVAVHSRRLNARLTPKNAFLLWLLGAPRG